MSVVSPSQSNPGDEITAAVINNPINQLAAVINGNIDATNIAAGAIGSTQLASSIPITRFTNPYKFSAYASGTTVLPNGAATKVILQVEEFDTGSNFDNATNYRFTAPAAGFYQFSAAVTVTTGGVERYFVSLYKNGAEFKRGNDIVCGSANDETYTVSGLLQLNANDYIEVYMFNGSATGRNVKSGQNTTYFTGYLVSAT